METYFSVAAIKRANAAAGFTFFRAQEMRHFHSRVLEGVYGGRYFVTSERQDWRTPRVYSVREIRPSGDVLGVTGHTGYASADAAKRAARKLAAEAATAEN